MTVRSVLMMMLLFGGATGAQAAEPRERMSVVSVRVHDYAKVEAQHLQQAQAQVRAIYARAGVRLEWRATVRPAEAAAGRATWPADVADVADVTVVVMTPVMAGRLGVPTEVAGYAPITRARGGRVAFVLGARVGAIADQGGAQPGQVLAGVMAHELAHLLMPERPHATRGLMRAHWTPSSFRQIAREDFTKVEQESLRRTARAISGERLRVAD